MTPEEMKQRTKRFGLRVIRLVQSLPEDCVSRRLGDQFLRAGTSVGANYRAACRARSAAEFRSKLGIVEEECDEAGYWMDLLVEAELVRQELLADLMKEANEILAIVISSIKTSRSNRPSNRTSQKGLTPK